MISIPKVSIRETGVKSTILKFNVMKDQYKKSDLELIVLLAAISLVLLLAVAWMMRG